ncbi:hypothetical protein [Sinorhizobium sp. 22678]|uniref:hypothetical protein n=1 Tax=Sinorhizobium sp. 22678 TaxID=3453955 RepID=UPI003F847B39
MGADRNQWQYPKNVGGKVIGWRDDGKGMENKDWVSPADLNGKQDHSANLDELAGVDPGSSGKSILALNLSADVRNYLDVAPYVETRTELKALDTGKDLVAILMESGREGIFHWKAGDYSAQIAADTQEGVYVKASAVAAASGAWVRQIEDVLKLEWFGALGGSTDDHTAIQAAWDMGALLKKVVLHSQSHRASEELKTSSDLHVRFTDGAWLRQTGVSTTGSFITNLRNSASDAATIQSNIVFENPQIDGSLYPAIVTGTAQAGAASTITLASDASAVDDFYNGLSIVILGGTGAAQSRTISDYVGSTRVATVSAAWTTPPDNTSVYQIGYNDNAFGFAAGASELTFRGGYVKNYPASAMTPAASGGKGINLEQGVTNAIVEGTIAENCGTGFFVQGLDGTFANGSKKRAVSIQLLGIIAKNCGSALTIAGVNTSADPDGDSDDSMIVVNGLTYENCGHSPLRVVGSGQQKAGIINLLEAQNVSIANVRGRNDTGYPNTSPGYPTDYSARVGFGLTGNVGAMIWGWGRNIKVNGFVHHGNVDNPVAIRRGRALGDDASSSGAPENCFNWSLAGLEIHGVTNEYVIRIDPTLANRVAAAELSGEVEIAVNGSFVTSGLVDTNMSSFSGITLTTRDHVGGKTVIGTPQQINAAGNTFGSFGGGRSDLRKVDRVLNSISIAKTSVIADDGVYSWAVPSGTTAFELIIHQAAGSARGHLAYLNGSWNIIVQTSTLIETSTSVLTGTTGTDTKVTVSFNGGTIYIENRLGSSYTPYVIPKYYG